MHFGMDAAALARLGAEHTAAEIAQQPGIWEKTLALVEARREELRSFLGRVIDEPDFDVVLAGAGTSEYVGRTANTALNRALDYRVRAYGTTDLVVDPERYLSKDKPTLLISFARSGNSPESVGAVEAADQVCGRVIHLFITCNGDGALARRAQGRDNCCSLELPPETNDQGFAMTSSFTSMYLAALLAFRLDALPEMRALLAQLCQGARRFLDSGWPVLRDLTAEFDFDRVVFLGSGSLKGVAQESALKMLELNAGKVAAFHDSPMGFRHGPKSIIDGRTLTVLDLSDDAYIRRYEMDLARELCTQRRGNRLLAVTNRMEPALAGLADYSCAFQCADSLPQELLAPLSVLPAQVLALFKSLRSGVRPDDPCPSGEVSRVVRGVKIYPYQQLA